MVPQILFDLSDIDLNKIVHGVDEIERNNPHRGHMRLMEAIVHITDKHAIAYKDVRDDEFWAAGHMPGRPIFPGVLMIEAAAQMASFLRQKLIDDGRYMLFAGVQDVKFRGQVVPGDRFYVLVEAIELRPRRFICNWQGMVKGNIVVQGQLAGMPHNF